MDGDLEVSDGWEMELGGFDGVEVEKCFANGLATDNPWPGELIGFDSGDRVVDARVLETNYYLELDAVAANGATLSAMELVGPSCSKHPTSVPLKMVPYVEQEELVVGGTHTQENTSAETLNHGRESENKDTTKGVESLLPTATWGERLDGVEELFGHMRGMNDYARKLESALYKIAVVVCEDHMIRDSIGQMVPPELLQVASDTLQAGSENSVVEGVIVPGEFKIQFGSIGITCREKYKCAFEGGVGATAITKRCMNESCAQNRYPMPNADGVWNLTRWIENDATNEDLSMCWYNTGTDGVLPIPGLDFKNYMESGGLGVDMFAAFTNLLRQLETCAYNNQPKPRTIHYVDHQWASMVTAGLLSGNASVQAFYTPKPAYLISACTMVMAPVRVQDQWSCYAMDFENMVVSVMDPNFTINSSRDLAAHEKNAILLLKESARCMRKLGGNKQAGRGEWRGVVMLPRHGEGGPAGMREQLGSLLPCLMGFNGEYVCGTTEEICQSWGRRELVYSLLHMAGGVCVGSGVPDATVSTADSDRGSGTAT